MDLIYTVHQPLSSHMLLQMLLLMLMMLLQMLMLMLMMLMLMSYNHNVKQWCYAAAGFDLSSASTPLKLHAMLLLDRIS